VHGGSSKNKDFFINLKSISSYFEEVCLLEIERITQLEIKNRMNNHIHGIPIVRHLFTAQAD
jgi:hypothetical protein